MLTSHYRGMRNALAVGLLVLCSAWLCACDPPPVVTARDAHSVVVGPKEDAGSADLATADASEADIKVDSGNSEDSGIVVGFDDHSHGAFERSDALLAYLSAGSSRAQAKFVITELPTANASVRFLQPGFYGMHDEWYWFRLLNGEPAIGADVEPIQGLSFASIEEINIWAMGQTTLPLDLRILDDGRVYSNHFYRVLGLGTDRVFGLGSIVHIPARQEPAMPEQWLFELEHSDAISHTLLIRFFEILTRNLPDAVASSLKWVVRSEQHRALAADMAAQQLLYWDRVADYRDFVVPGEVEVYNAGLVAGVLKKFAAGETIQGTDAESILILDEIPDLLPPATALITAVPQTPLAHINLLARNRGIPNAYLGGVSDDLELEQLARARMPVIVKADEDGSLKIQAISPIDYNRYKSMGSRPSLSASPVDVDSIPFTVSLAEHSLADMDELRPSIGGKAAGFLPLLEQFNNAFTGLAAPPAPVAITVKAYIEHVTPLTSRLQALLADSEFRDQERARFLLLEGEAAYDQTFANAVDQAYKLQLLQLHSPVSLIGSTVAAGGIRGIIQRRAIAPTTLAEITAVLQQHFGSYALTQGLRFRSSSNVEDIEGFNGAGLYVSTTGFLHPEAQERTSDQVKSVAWALKQTWSSYWGAEAFEERRLYRVDHMSGAMAVLVHARFDDEQERANGVFTMTLSQHDIGSSDEQNYAVMEINSQIGSQSVTNPENAGALPEVSRLSQGADDAPVFIERLAASTEVEAGTWVIDEAHMRSLFNQARSMTATWLAYNNSAFSVSQQGRSLVLDFEFRWMKDGWPALVEGPQHASRIVVKQARSLEPTMPTANETLLGQPIPRDVLRRARRIEQQRCTSSQLEYTTLRVFTNKDLQPNLGFADMPFNAYFIINLLEDLPGLNLPARTRVSLLHTAFSQAHSTSRNGTWVTHYNILAGSVEQAGIDHVSMRPDGGWTLSRADSSDSGTGLSCRLLTVYSSPQDFLLGLLDSAQ